MRALQNLSNAHQGYLYTFVTMLIWGSFSLFARINAYWQIQVWDTLFLRFLVAGLIILPIVIFKKQWRFLLDYRMVLIAITGSVGYCAFVYSGFFYAPVAHGAVLLNGTFPLFTALIASLMLGQKIDRSTQLSLAIIIVTLMFLAMMMKNDPVGFGFGDVMFLCSGALYGLFSTLLRRWQFTAWQVVCGIAIWSMVLYLPIYFAFFTPDLAHIQPYQLAMQAFFHGVLVVIVATLTYAKAVEKIGLFQASSIATLAPFLSAVVAVPLLNEPLSPLMLYGLIGMGIGALQPWRWWNMLKNRQSAK